MHLQPLWRKAGATSFWDAALQILRYLAIAFAVGFAVYLPTARYTHMGSAPRVFWFVVYVVALLYAQTFPYLPKVGKRGSTRAETARLKSTNVAVTRMTTAVVKAKLDETEFLETAHGLLSAIKQEVQAIVLENDANYINATLMVEDPVDASRLCTLARANADRPGMSYPKSGLVVWEAMERNVSCYRSRFNDPAKEYHCILVIPLVTQSKSGGKISVGAVSIDSGTPGDFDASKDKIELRLLPYVSLLELLLTLRASKELNP